MPVSPAEEILRFGLFELDIKAGQLRKGGMRVRLPQQPIQLLAMLSERPGEVVTREELRQRLWPKDVFVDFDHGLNKAVQKLRDALGDSAESPRYIETIPRVGYRFVAPVSAGASPAAGETHARAAQNGNYPPSSLVEEQTALSEASQRKRDRKTLWLVATGCFILLAAGAGWLIHRRQQQLHASFIRWRCFRWTICRAIMGRIILRME